jgi:hypothetical protein
VRLLCLWLCALSLCGRTVDLTHAVVVTRGGELPKAEKTAATVLVEEIGKRAGIRLPVSTVWPQGKTAIAVTSRANVPGWPQIAVSETRAEGYRLFVQEGDTPVVWIAGADPRGTLFGVGRLLRKLDWDKGRLSIKAPLDISTAPAYPIRGHQLGYRAQANSYDAWSVAQFEQYIRDLTFFGVNSIESIPFQDDRPTPVMKVPRREMNRALSEICDRYGLDYWAWVPADFDLSDRVRRARMVAQLDEFFHDCPQLTGIFVPGGDPGDNPPEAVLPFLEEMARRLRPLHPKAKVWLSLQRFSPAQMDGIYAYLDREKPDWFGGLVAGPSSPPLQQIRARLSSQYGLRDYPDLTHNKLCQYEVPQWDQAYALTLGR